MCVWLERGERGNGLVLGDDEERESNRVQPDGRVGQQTRRPASKPSPPEAWSEEARAAAPSDSLDETGMAGLAREGMAPGSGR